MSTCTICRREFRLEDSPAPPFCSERCRKIDLGRWLDERYTLPIEREDGEQPQQTDDEQSP